MQTVLRSSKVGLEATGAEELRQEINQRQGIK